MTNIIVINGPCGIGKSTIAQALHSALPGSYLRSKDIQRRMISGYHDTPQAYKQSAVTVHNLFKGIITTCIDTQTPVIYEGFLRHGGDIDQLRRISRDRGGKFFHIILDMPKDLRRERLYQRGVGGSLTYEKAEGFYDDIQTLKPQSEHVLIDATDGVDHIVETILSYLK